MLSRLREFLELHLPIRFFRPGKYREEILDDLRVLDNKKVGRKMSREMASRNKSSSPEGGSSGPLG